MSSEPDLIHDDGPPASDPSSTLQFKVEGMTCGSCVARIEKAIQELPDIDSVTVNLATGTATVQGRPTPEQVIEKIQGLGYQAQVFPSEAEQFAGSDSHSERNRFLLAAALSLPLIAIAMGPGMTDHENPVLLWTQWLLATPIVLGCGAPFFASAWKQLRHFSANMDTLVALGGGTAYLAGSIALLTDQQGEPVYFETAAVIITLILMGRTLEARARRQAGSAIRSLMALQPKTASRRRGNEYEDVPVNQIQPGDVLMVRPGEKFPVDGEVIEGLGGVNESMMTGESIPVSKKPGDGVIGGTINLNGSIVFRATRVGSRTQLASMIRQIEEVQAQKPRIQRLADEIAGIFVPVVIGVALITLTCWLVSEHTMAEALRSMVAVLIIACPCAMGLATPTAIQAASGKAASLGFLIRNIESLEQMRGIDILAFDKTGTLTEGHPQVTDTIFSNGTSNPEILALVATVENRSEHPLARAIVRHALDEGLTLHGEVAHFEALAGEGVAATVQDGHENARKVWIGSRSFLQKQVSDKEIEQNDWQQLTSQADTLEAEGKTTLFARITGPQAGDVSIALLAVQDPVRPNAPEAVRNIQALGIRPVMMTGDRRIVAEAIAIQAGIEGVLAEQFPEEKRAEVEAYQERGFRVGMVGDGINDAPALAQADLSFAVGSGTDVAMSVADITLVNGDLSRIPVALALGKKTLQVIRQNLFWAFFYNIVSIPIAAFGLLNPMIAAAAMAFSSVSVVLNSLRLSRFNDRKPV